jgi:hypothetical protein
MVMDKRTSSGSGNPTYSTSRPFPNLDFSTTYEPRRLLPILHPHKDALAVGSKSDSPAPQ